MLNLIGGLVAYCLNDNKPSLNMSELEMSDIVKV